MQLVNIINRSENLPQIHKLSSHPQVNPNHKGQIYVLYMDVSVAAAAKIFANASQYDGNGHPQGKGFLILQPYDILFIRKHPGSGLPKNDVLVGMQTDKEILSDRLINEAMEAQRSAMGPEEAITQDRPRITAKKKYEGGLLIERSDRSVNVQGCPRAYTLGISYETAPKLHAPAPGNKDSEGDRENLDIRKKLLKVATTLGLEALRHAPGRLKEHLHEMGEVGNVPCIGHPENNIFPNVQLNIATPIEETNDAVQHLQASLGTFGGRHLDGYDSAASLTAMSNLSKLPDWIHPGYFYLFELGICWVLHPLTTILFSGLRWHGGCSPIYAKGLSLPNDAYRLCLISYPPSAIVDGNSQAGFAACPHQKANLFKVCGEITARPYQQTTQPHSEHSNYVQDGGSIMEPHKHFQYVARTLLQLVHYFVGQLPREYRARVDRDLFLSSLSMEVAGGTRQQAGPWPLGIGWVPEEGQALREEAWKRVADFIRDVAPTLPSIMMACEGKPDLMLEGGHGARITSE